MGKRERFKDVMFGVKMWDMVTNFGFETKPDGKLEVYHHGEYFKGYLPIFSLVVKAIFYFHSYFVAFATQHHLSSVAFTEDEELEEMEERSRSNMVWHILKDHIFEDLKAGWFGGKAKPHGHGHDHV